MRQPIESSSMSHAVTSAFSVRSYEVDSYAHLNNGVYLSWFEQGRLDYLQSLGFSYDGLKERGAGIVVRRVEVDFLSPLHTGDTTQMTTRIKKMGGTSVHFVQTLVTQDENPTPVAKATTVMVFANDQGACPIPDDFRQAVGPDNGGCD